MRIQQRPFGGAAKLRQNSDTSGYSQLDISFLVRRFDEFDPITKRQSLAPPDKERIHCVSQPYKPILHNIAKSEVLSGHDIQTSRVLLLRETHKRLVHLRRNVPRELIKRIEFWAIKSQGGRFYLRNYVLFPRSPIAEGQNRHYYPL